MSGSCLRHLLFLAVSQLSAGQETMETLGISAGSQFAAVFNLADANKDGVLSDMEHANFTEEGEELVRNFTLLEPFEVTLFAELDCKGQSSTVDGSGNETRCSQCFDSCGKSFDGGSAMAVLNGSVVSGVESKVRSLRVTSGTPQVVTGLCLGTYNYGVAGIAATSIRSVREGCLNFPGPGPAHLAPLARELGELAATVFLKVDVAPFDGRLDAGEASAAGLGSLLRAADEDEDGFLSTEEYATLLVRDAARRAARKAFMSAGAMEDAAATWATAEAAASGRAPGATDVAADAEQLFGQEYELAKADPARGVPTTTPEPKRVNGNIIVFGGPSGGDYGDVRDPSPVEGPYDPQTGDILLCVDGKEFHAGLCYDYCKWDYPLETLNMCWKQECPDGWMEIAGGICKKNGWNLDTMLMENYDRGMGELPAACTLGGSFGPGSVIDDGTRDFTVVMVSDTQLPWCSGTHKSDVDCAIAENWRLVQGIHEVQQLVWPADGNETAQQVAEPLGVFITGDLTAFAHSWQYHLYRKIWETREGEDPDKNLKLPVWPGLGNHDYANNIDDCLWIVEEPIWAGYWRNSCAQRMMAYVRSAVAGCDGKTVVKNFGGKVDHYDRDSAGYTVRHGRIRFVHLHNYPTFRRQQLTGVASTMQFLKDEVAEAERTLDYLVLLIHDVNGHFSPWSTDPQVDRYHYFSEVVAGSRTIAVMSGHFHPSGGHRSNLQDSRSQADLVNGFGETVPVIRSYAPDYHKFVLTQWNVARCYWRFGAVEVPTKDEPKGRPSWYYPGDDTQLSFYALPNCTIMDETTTTTMKSYFVSASPARFPLLALALLTLALLA